MKLKFDRDMVFLINMYKAKEGTLAEISKDIGIKLGHLYQFKRDLEDKGIIIYTGKNKTVKLEHRVSYRKIHKIDHKKLDEYFLNEPLMQLWVKRWSQK